MNHIGLKSMRGKILPNVGGQQLTNGTEQHYNRDKNNGQNGFKLYFSQYAEIVILKQLNITRKCYGSG